MEQLPLVYMFMFKRFSLMKNQHWLRQCARVSFDILFRIIPLALSTLVTLFAGSSYLFGWLNTG